MKKQLDSYQKKLLKLIQDSPDEIAGLTLQQIDDEYLHIGYTQWVINKLKQLEAKGFIKKDENSIYRAIKDSINDIFYFPILGFAQCGNKDNFDLDSISSTERLGFPTSELPVMSNEDLEKFFFTRAKWNSMVPDIKDGDLVLVKLQPDSNPSDMTLIIHNGSPKIKHITQSGKTFALVSLNKEVPDLEIAYGDDLKIIWVVKKVISSH